MRLSAQLEKLLLVGIALLSGPLLVAQQRANDSDRVPIATQWLLNGVSSSQRGAIQSVVMVVCPADNKKGTAFFLDSCLVATNAHVVGSCTAEQLRAVDVLGKPVTFTRIFADSLRDLALLCPTKRPAAGLRLGSDEGPRVEAKVSTWGFPLSYQGPAPLLSVGYVAGFTEDSSGARPVKRLIINGAFNPGNSGGPLLDATGEKVIGVVVAKWTLFSPNVAVAIQGFSHPRGMTGGTFSISDEHGTRGVSNEEMLAVVLDEFYRTSQVMIGEAVAVSELKGLIAGKQADLRADPTCRTLTVAPSP